MPIGDATIFESKGFQWNDLINVGGDTVSFYEKGKIFELDSAHPNGTVFFTQESEEYYLVENGKKHFLPTSKIAQSWTRKTPVSVSERSLEAKEICSLEMKETFWNKRYLNCQLNVQALNTIIGTDYEFYLEGKTDFEFSEANIILKKNKNKENFDIFLESIISRIKQHYDK